MSSLLVFNRVTFYLLSSSPPLPCVNKYIYVYTVYKIAFTPQTPPSRFTGKFLRKADI